MINGSALHSTLTFGVITRYVSVFMLFGTTLNQSLVPKVVILACKDFE